MANLDPRAWNVGDIITMAGQHLRVTAKSEDGQPTLQPISKRQAKAEIDFTVGLGELCWRAIQQKQTGLVLFHHDGRFHTCPLWDGIHYWPIGQGL